MIVIVCCTSVRPTLRKEKRRMCNESEEFMFYGYQDVKESGFRACIGKRWR